MKAKKKNLPNGQMLAAGAVLFVLGFGAVVAAQHVLPRAGLSFSREKGFVATTSSVTAVPPVPEVMHVPTPAAVKAIYMSQCAVGTQSFRDSLTKLIETTELNSIIIDIRDYTGKISFNTENPVLKPMVSSACGARDMKEFIKSLHEKNIYVIGRITTFQNPFYTKLHPEQAVQRKGGGTWKDHKGLAFVDVGAKPYWDTVVELAKESHTIGFDELNFDYIRFPSDGPMAEAVYSWDAGKTKQEALEGFFKYLYDHVHPTGVVMSADLFGMTSTNYDDLNIGQVLERAMPYFDYIDPMVYPSHYPTGFNGYKNVNQHSYDIVNFSLSKAVERAVASSTKISSFAYERIGTSTLYAKPVFPALKIRPWLQSFDYPVVYTPEMVAAQIKANTDAGLNSYLFWDPANKYNSLRHVLKLE